MKAARRKSPVADRPQGGLAILRRQLRHHVLAAGPDRGRAPARAGRAGRPASRSSRGSGAGRRSSTTPPRGPPGSPSGRARRRARSRSPSRNSRSRARSAASWRPSTASLRRGARSMRPVDPARPEPGQPLQPERATEPGQPPAGAERGLPEERRRRARGVRPRLLRPDRPRAGVEDRSRATRRAGRRRSPRSARPGSARAGKGLPVAPRPRRRADQQRRGGERRAGVEAEDPAAGQDDQAPVAGQPLGLVIEQGGDQVGIDGQEQVRARGPAGGRRPGTAPIDGSASRSRKPPVDVEDPPRGVEAEPAHSREHRRDVPRREQQRHGGSALGSSSEMDRHLHGNLVGGASSPLQGAGGIALPSLCVS